MDDRDITSTIPSPAPAEDSDSCVGHEMAILGTFPVSDYRFANSWSEEWNTDRFERMFQIQKDQQQELGLDPADLGEVERRIALGDLTLQLFEEAGELSRIASVHKRHILRLPVVNPHAVAEEIVDVFKTTLCIAQMYGLSADDLFTAFRDKTAAVSAKATMERTTLENHTKVACFDLDDVICDLSPWRKELGFADERQLTAAQNLDALENMKSQFYQGGRFRKMEPISGAFHALHGFRAAGFKIAIITARPQWQFKRLRSDTVFWLNKHGIPFDLLIFSRNKVEAIHQHISPAWPAFFVEDLERNALELAKAGVKVLLYPHPHNSGGTYPENVTRVSGWDQIRQEYT